MYSSTFQNQACPRNSNMQISGILSKYIESNNSEPCYIQFIGPVQLCRYNYQIDNHGGSYHSDGYGSAIGKVKGFNKSIDTPLSIYI